MAGHGNTIPKDPARRRRQNKTLPMVEVVADGLRHGPDLPPGFDWPAQTRAWYDNWRTSPQAQTLTRTDWDFLLDTALLHAELWSGNGSVASELRLRVAKFGATPEDRARLRMQVGDDVTESAKSAAPKGSRYGHLKVVPGGS